MNIPTLSKSRFMAGLQCHLRLWYECKHRDLLPDTSPVKQAVFDTGHEVGRLATELYPGGVHIKEDHFHHDEAVKSTQAIINDPNVPAIYEAAFLEDGVRVRVDILERVKNGKWNLIEVKSSNSAKKQHVPDVAVQMHVLQRAGLEVNQVEIMHLNREYVYNGKNLELSKLFAFTDLTEEALAQQGVVPSQLAEFKKMLGKKNPPKILPSQHCKRPYHCDFRDYCTREMPEYWIWKQKGISDKKRNELRAMGVEDMREIPADFSLSPKLQLMRDCVVNQEEHIGPGLREELMKVEYPIHFLDFETIGPAVPRYGGTSPYLAVPFQWSDHIMDENGNLDHRAYLCLEDKDPREEFTETLLETLGKEGSIVVYTMYERDILKILVKQLLHYSDRLLAVIDRLYDLCEVVKNHYYHPEFHGSFSLKAVLPAVVPEMKYENLEIQEGQMASLEYLRMIDPSTTPEEKEKIKNDLLEYCCQDTLAMVEIRKELLKRLKL